MYFLCNHHITEGHTGNVNSPGTRHVQIFQDWILHLLCCRGKLLRNWEYEAQCFLLQPILRTKPYLALKWSGTSCEGPCSENPRLQNSLGFISLDAQYSAFISDLQPDEPQAELRTGVISLDFRAYVPALDGTYL